MGAISIAKKVQAALVARFASLDTVVSAEYPVRGWRDNSQEREFPAVLVHCTPAIPDPGTPGGPVWQVTATLAVFSHPDDDPTGDEGDEVFDAMVDEVINMIALTTTVPTMTGLDARCGMITDSTEGEQDGYTRRSIEVQIVVTTQ